MPSPKLPRLLLLQIVLLFKYPGSMWLQRLFDGRWVYVAWLRSWCKGFCKFSTKSDTTEYNLNLNTLHFPVQNVNEVITNYIIGDPAYPLRPHCIKEYESCSNDAEVIFNSMLRSARNQIECDFGCLKARWAILIRKI